MKAALAAAGLLLLVGCGAPKNDLSPAASAAPKAPKFSDTLVTDDDTAKTPKSTFAPDTPKIFVSTSFENVKVGSKIHVSWIADKAEGAAPNFKIQELDLNVAPMVNVANTDMSSPTKGWPVGDYHVDFSIDGKSMTTAKFSVAK